MRFRRELLESLCKAAETVYPDEFIALLSVKGNPELVEEFVVVQATFGKNFSSFRLDLLPFDSKIVGSIHSHPSSSNNPSPADLRVFSRGKINLIIAWPFDLKSIKAFDSSGKQVELVIE
ncbi:Mov34/MPN/PAD-1 family protein [archaeon]|nr:Mov34/MPN/PAD-1 family protein [archaeon]